MSRTSRVYSLLQPKLGNVIYKSFLLDFSLILDGEGGFGEGIHTFRWDRFDRIKFGDWSAIKTVGSCILFCTFLTFTTKHNHVQPGQP